MTRREHEEAGDFAPAFSIVGDNAPHEYHTVGSQSVFAVTFVGLVS